MKSELPELTEALLKARDVIKTRGWCQDRSEDMLGQVCAAGAIHVAISNSAKGSCGVHCKPMISLMGYIGAGDGINVVDWNDAPERTRAEVEAAFEAAASLSMDGCDGGK